MAPPSVRPPTPYALRTWRLALSDPRPRRRRRDRADPAHHLATRLPSHSPSPGAGRARRSLDGAPVADLDRGPAVAATPGAGRGRAGGASRTLWVRRDGCGGRGGAGSRRGSGHDASRPMSPSVTDLLVEPRWGRRGHGSRLLAACVDLWRDGRLHDRPGLGVRGGPGDSGVPHIGRLGARRRDPGAGHGRHAGAPGAPARQPHRASTRYRPRVRSPTATIEAPAGATLQLEQGAEPDGEARAAAHRADRQQHARHERARS